MDEREREKSEYVTMIRQPQPRLLQKEGTAVQQGLRLEESSDKRYTSHYVCSPQGRVCVLGVWVFC